MGESHFLSSQRRPSPWLGPVALGHPGEAAASRPDTGTVPALRAAVEGQWRPPGHLFPSWGHSPELALPWEGDPAPFRGDADLWSGHHAHHVLSRLALAPSCHFRLGCLMDTERLIGC